MDGEGIFFIYIIRVFFVIVNMFKLFKLMYNDYVFYKKILLEILFCICYRVLKKL